MGLVFSKKKLEIIIDGGMNGETTTLVRDVGATKVVGGSYLFNNRKGFGEKIETLK